MVACTRNPSSGKAEAGESLELGGPASLENLVSASSVSNQGMVFSALAVSGACAGPQQG